MTTWEEPADRPEIISRLLYLLECTNSTPGNMDDYLLQDFKYTSTSLKPKGCCRAQIFNSSHVYAAADFREEQHWLLLSFLLWALSPHLWFLIKYSAKNGEIFWNFHVPADNCDCCLDAQQMKNWAHLFLLLSGRAGKNTWIHYRLSIPLSLLELLL